MPYFEPFERVLLTIEYDGSAFYGWQRQARLRSVQEELERIAGDDNLKHLLQQK